LTRGKSCDKIFPPRCKCENYISFLAIYAQDVNKIR
jgi:hypothetical protein